MEQETVISAQSHISGVNEIIDNLHVLMLLRYLINDRIMHVIFGAVLVGAVGQEIMPLVLKSVLSD